MSREQAEQIVLEFMKPLFGFAKSRCATAEDAEDITQEICVKLFSSLLKRQDITEPNKFAWTIAHNALANYYRGRFRHGINVPIHELVDALPAEGDFTKRIEEMDTIEKLHREIAYLSKTRRQIVIMYYMENMRQQKIADKLGLSLGTVKWYLSDSKNELQKGMVKLRKAQELKFYPIVFGMISTQGSSGTNGRNETLLRSALTQNILFLARNDAMSINALADALGVSPVYIESEVEFLEENAFMVKRGNKYIANVLIEVPTTQSNRLKNEAYESAANLFAAELFDAFYESILKDNNGVYTGFTNELKIINFTEGKSTRRHMHQVEREINTNFLMWSLIPYTIARSKTPSSSVTFEDAATIRPDGGVNICHCIVATHDVEPLKYSARNKKLRGHGWSSNEKSLLWLINTEWGGSRRNTHLELLNRDLASLEEFFSGMLGENEILRMVERGYLSRRQVENVVVDKLEIVWLTPEADKRLRRVANSVSEKYQAEFDKLKTKLAFDAPNHLKKASVYCLQDMFISDMTFIVYVLNKLVESGKLQLPTEVERDSIGAVFVSEL